MLEDVQDPGNIGSILRSAAAAGVTEIYLSTGCVHAWSPRVLRAGMGAHSRYASTKAWISRCSSRVIAALFSPRFAMRRVRDSVDLRGQVGLLFGNEGAGLSARCATPRICRSRFQCRGRPNPLPPRRPRSVYSSA